MKPPQKLRRTASTRIRLRTVCRSRTRTTAALLPTQPPARGSSTAFHMTTSWIRITWMLWTTRKRFPRLLIVAFMSTPTTLTPPTLRRSALLPLNLHIHHPLSPYPTALFRKKVPVIRSWATRDTRTTVVTRTTRVPYPGVFRIRTWLV